jgi:hypothetical protein
MDALMNFGTGIFGGAWPAVWTLIKIVLIVAPLMLGVAYLTYFERKVIGYMQVRIGPNRVGPWGLIQPIADGLKLLMKEIIVPAAPTRASSSSPRCWQSRRRWRPGRLCPSPTRWSSPTSTPACSTSWPSLRWVCTGSSCPVGLPTPSTLSSAPCARRRRWFPMKSRWASR